jgi:hypothetical protein
MVAGVLAEIRTERLASMGLERYRYTSLLGPIRYSSVFLPIDAVQSDLIKAPLNKPIMALSVAACDRYSNSRTVSASRQLAVRITDFSDN